MLCASGVFSTTTSLSAGTSMPISSIARLPFARSFFRKESSVQAFATTLAPRSGVRSRMSATVAATCASVTMPFSTSSSRRLTSINWK
jgi:hypothetical protein